MENNVRKGEIVCNEQFLLFSKCSLPYTVLVFNSKYTLECSVICFNLDQSKILLSGNGLKGIFSCIFQHTLRYKILPILYFPNALFFFQSH